MGISLKEAKVQLHLWLKANEVVSQGQSYSISNDNSSRTLTRVNAKEILQQIEFWDGQVRRLSRNVCRVRKIVIQG